jgi:ABC-2 type transport system permease protein
MRHLVATHLHDRRRSVLAWGLPLGLWSAFIVSIFPSIEDALSKATKGYPPALKEAFGVSELANVEQYLQAEMLSLIVPLALGYMAVRAVASGLSGAAETGRLDVLLSAPVSRSALAAASFAATAVELALVLAVTIAFTGLGSALSGAGLQFGSAVAGFANVWPLALLFAGLGVVASGWSLRTSVVTGSVAGVLVSMYVIDPDWQARLRSLRCALHLGLQVLRKRNRRRRRAARFLWRRARGRGPRDAWGLAL